MGILKSLFFCWEWSSKNFFWIKKWKQRFQKKNWKKFVNFFDSFVSKKWTHNKTWKLYAALFCLFKKKKKLLNFHAFWMFLKFAKIPMPTLHTKTTTFFPKFLFLFIEICNKKLFFFKSIVKEVCLTQNKKKRFFLSQAL